MNKFIIDSRQIDFAKFHFEIQKKNGWTEAYVNVPGNQSYQDGLYTGLMNGYAEAVHDVKSYIKSLVEKNPNCKASKLLDLIVFDKKKK